METNYYEAPEMGKKAFTCPHCKAYATMDWEWLFDSQLNPFPLMTAKCHCCNEFSVWRIKSNSQQGVMINPTIYTAPIANKDLPKDCLDDYQEAREISPKSPRGAAALLRLCIQRLCIHLGGSGIKLNEDIATLVENGLPEKIQQALDIVRVIGNNAVHPGEISFEDQPQTVTTLFNLVNMIVEYQITQPNKVKEIFSSLPEGSKESIKKRDNKA